MFLTDCLPICDAPPTTKIVQIHIYCYKKHYLQIKAPRVMIQFAPNNLGIQNVLVECGKELTYKMLKSGLINEFFLFKSNNKIINREKLSILSINRLLKFFKKKKQVKTFLDKDTLIHYY